MTRKGLAKRIDRSPELQLIRDESRRIMAELALDRLQVHLEKGEPWAIRYVLSRVGYLVNWGTPPVRITPYEDPSDLLARLDAIERELIGTDVPLRDYLALLELRRAAVADLHRAGDIEPIIEQLAMEIKRVVEGTIEDPEKRKELLRRLAEILGGGPRDRRAG
jgi:hypothetical protein